MLGIKVNALKDTIESFKKTPKERKIYGVFVLFAGAGTAYLSHAVVNFFHLVFLYGPKEVLSHNLHFIYKGITIVGVSNGDHLSSTHSICNFVTVCVSWFYMLGLTHLVVSKIFNRLAPDFFDKFYKKINIP